MTGFLKGLATALITPFRGDGVNFAVLEQLIDRQIEGGADAIVILGTTGEPSTMTEAERESVVRRAVKRADGRVKIIVGTGSNCTQKAISESRLAEAMGADGVLCVTPYYNKCTQNGLIDYYHAIADAVKIPVIAYNVPSRTGVNILPETMEQIARVPNIAGIKEASGDMRQVLRTARLIEGKCDLYSGEDELNLPILLVGGTAVISVLSNLLPAAVKELTELVKNGETQKAIALSHRLCPLSAACFTEVNPIPVKAGMRLVGFDVGDPRPPLTRCESANVKKLKDALNVYGVKI